MNAICENNDNDTGNNFDFNFKICNGSGIYPRKYIESFMFHQKFPCKSRLGSFEPSDIFGIVIFRNLFQTRRERLKSALYLRLKKRKTFFLEKNLKFSKKKFLSEMSHSAGKCKRGTLFDL